MDPIYPKIDSSQFPVLDWIGFYGDVEEDIHPIASGVIGKVVDLCMFVSSDHAGAHCMQKILYWFPCKLKYCAYQFCPQNNP